jgi:hypothetical protein
LYAGYARALAYRGFALATDAATFHALAGDHLVRLGFSLANDPNQTRGRYSDSSADYQCSCGLWLSVGFENDSGSALVFFGRRWFLGQGDARVSNHLAILARRFGIDTPISYPLSWGDQRAGEIATILTELKRSLPEVMKRVTLDDLIQVEREQFGAETLARAQFGTGFDRSVRVSSFQAQ